MGSAQLRELSVGFNFIAADRDQSFLLPPDMRDWLPADHLAWFVIEVVERVDLSRFRSAYRVDGHGRPAYDPSVLVALLLYAYCTGTRSSRVIERRCTEDVAFRVPAGGLCPDHVTIARFRSRHADALAGVLVASLRLCADAGLVRLGAVALDGTKMGANASLEANRTLEALDREVTDMIAEAEAVDAAEDHQENDRGGSLPPGMSDPATRRRRLSEAQQRLEQTAARRAEAFQRRCEQANIARAAMGLPTRQFKPRPRDEAPQPQATTNLTDPDSRVLIGRHGRLQGYNAQLVTTAEQIIVAAAVTQAANDVEQLAPMLSATRDTLAAAGISDEVEALVADAGYWRASSVDGSIRNAPQLFIAVAKHGRRGRARKDGKPAEDKTAHLVEAMKARLATETGKTMMRIRRTSVEPVFAHTKDIRGIRGFTRRSLSAAQAEWQLIAGTHNLLKLYRARVVPA
jgi:transposase